MMRLGRKVPGIWSKQQEEVINSTLKQVTLEWKGYSWPQALGWQLFILQWRLYTKLVQYPCENGIGFQTFVLSIYFPRFYGLWGIFIVLECSHKRYKKDVKENNFFYSNYNIDSPNICVLMQNNFGRKWYLGLGFGKKKKKSQTYIYLCRFLQLCVIMQKFPKASEPSGINDVISRYI